MNTVSVDMLYQRSTKNTHVYIAHSSKPVTQLYIKKDGLASEPPEKIRLTIEVPAK